MTYGFSIKLKRGVPSRTKVRAELPLVLSYASADKQFRFFFLHCAASPHTVPFALVGSGYLIRSYSLPYMPRSCVPASSIPRCTYLSHLLLHPFPESPARPAGRPRQRQGPAPFAYSPTPDTAPAHRQVQRRCRVSFLCPYFIVCFQIRSSRSAFSSRHPQTWRETGKSR